LMHECWAGLLAALSLGLYPGEASSARPLRLAASLAAALAAGLVRELALPFLGVMALMRHTLPADPGLSWVRLGGWGFVLAANRWNAVLALRPWLPAVLVPAALVGALDWAGPVGRRLALTLLGYVA